MSKQTFRFQVGNFQCIAVSDGTLTYAPPNFPPPAAFLFANAPRERLEQALLDHDLQLDEWTGWTSPYICLLVDTGEHRVLVDTGAGALAPSTGKLVQNLKAEGISPPDIDTVVLTHGHPDHLGGNTDAGGNPVFRNARHVMSKEEWEFWTSGRAEEVLDEHIRDVLVGFARKNLPPIEDRLTLVDAGTEIVPGVRAIAAPGHTPGHMALTISSGGERLLGVSDAVLHPIHLEHPEWHAAVDVASEEVPDTRRRLLSMAANEKALVLAFHFPFPGLGRVVAKGEEWQWHPTETG